MKTYNDIYLAAWRSLRDAGIDAYSLEARLIAVSAAEKTKEQFVRDMRLYAGDDYEEKVGDMIRRRIGGEPVAYITGEWEFYGLPLTISEDVLIPRTDTETLVDTAIEALKTKESPRILDLGAGSGCVGLALAANVPDCRVVMVDNSAKALRLCRTNILRNNLTRSITCVEADALASPPMLLGLFDIIVSNPPYIPTADIAGFITPCVI
jgi:release factor glutamine methyltransferase